MGLSAGQARYLFISNRITDIQGSLMLNSARQMRLADEASDIAEAKEAALNCTHYEFNGNAEFDYDSFMGESAMNSDKGLYFLLTNDGNNRVVLNNTYARGMRAAGINEEGGSETPAGLYAFMNAVVGSPDKNSGAKDWNEVKTGIKTVSAEEVAEWTANKEADLQSKLNNFYAENGKVCPLQGNDPAKTVEHVETKYKDMTVSEILSKMGNTNNFSGISNLDGRSTAGSRYIQEQTNVNGSFQNLVNSNGYVCLIDDQEDLSYDEIWSRSRKAFENLANNIIGKISQATGIADLQSKLKPIVDQMKNQINGSLRKTEDGDEDDARDGGRDTAKRSVIGVGVDDTGTDQVWVYCNPSELTRRLLTATANIYKQQGSSNPSALTSVQSGSTSLNKNAVVSQPYEYKWNEYHPYTSETGKTYQEWNNAYNALSQEVKNYKNNGTVPAMPTQYVSVKGDAKTKLANYEQIFVKACQNGWKEDGQLDQANLTAKLVNNQYLINNNNVTETAKTSEAFANVKTNDRDEVIAYYDRQEKQLKSKEKKLEVENTNLQTELSALQTEEASVKSIIDQNIQRGFSLFS